MEQHEGEHARWLLLKGAIDAGFQRDRLEDILDKIDREPDRGVADGARGYLVKSGGLADDALASLGRRPGFSEGPIQRILDEEMELRRARQASVDRDLLRSAESGFKSVQLVLLDRRDLPGEVLRFLAATGATRAIRNRAAERLRP